MTVATVVVASALIGAGISDAATSSLNLAAGQNESVTCTGPQLQVNPLSATALRLICDQNPVTTTTTVPKTTTTAPVTTTTRPVTTTTVAPVTTTTTPAGGTGMISDIYKQWSKGPNPTGSPNFFPIDVYYQNFNSVATGQTVDDDLAYEKAGINTFLLGDDWTGGASPNPDYPDAAKDGMNCWCDVNGGGTFGFGAPYQQITEDADNSTASGVQKANTVQGVHEADMLQVNYGTNNPLTARNYASQMGAIQKADPARPTYSEFGKCFTITDWPGCGVYYKTMESPSETYDQTLDTYCSTSNIVGGDFFADNEAVTSWDPPYSGTGYEFSYGLTVQNIKNHCSANTLVGFDVATGDPFGDGTSGISTPARVTQQTWDGIMHGANFVDYFVDDMNGDGSVNTQDALLTSKYAATLAAVTANDAKIKTLAPWLNSFSQSGVTVSATNGVPVTTMLKTYDGHEYLLAMSDGSTKDPLSGNTDATFTVAGAGTSSAVVFGESRNVAVTNGSFSDSFAPYQLHVYELS